VINYEYFQIAKQYLDKKAKEFNANFQVTEEGALSYHFDV
jgi:hypothetical protein